MTFIYFANFNNSYAISPISDQMIKGIDVSNWQGNIDYSRSKTKWNRNSIYKSKSGYYI